MKLHTGNGAGNHAAPQMNHVPHHPAVVAGAGQHISPAVVSRLDRIESLLERVLETSDQGLGEDHVAEDCCHLTATDVAERVGTSHQAVGKLAEKGAVKDDSRLFDRRTGLYSKLGSNAVKAELERGRRLASVRGRRRG
ncbi:MAG TPA: hypothetical protein ENK57_26615 [Polyangiaceae bacterium]|nr:hypothetical protein [Polyangiaceae bacterium]